MTPTEPPLTCETPDAWSAWLAVHHATAHAVWLRIAKQGRGLAAVRYDEAVDVALCHGWIDGQRQGLDEVSFLQRFTARRPHSIWSQRNVQKAIALRDAGRMHPAGLAEMEAARADGRWARAYHSRKVRAPGET